jgi:hypothetical protein
VSAHIVLSTSGTPEEVYLICEYDPEQYRIETWSPDGEMMRSAVIERDAYSILKSLLPTEESD